MKTAPLYKRKYLRAPINSQTLFVNEGRVFKTKLQNISEGGVRLENHKFIKSNVIIPIVIDLPGLPNLEEFSISDLTNLSLYNFPRKIFRMEMIGLQRGPVAAGEFLNPRQDFIESVHDYVGKFLKNILHLIALISTKVELTAEASERIRTIAKILGYPKNLSLFDLREYILHDYRSLKKL